MAASSFTSGWMACGAVAAAIATVAAGSLVLRESARARLAATPPATILQPPGARPAAPGPKPAVLRADPARRPADQPEPSLDFDVVRVEPGGSAVVAGHGAPKIKVSLLDGERLIDTVETDASGEFVFVAPPLSSGAHVLRLTTAGGAPSRSVRVDVPSVGRKPAAVAARSAPAAPIALVRPPTTAPMPAPPAAPEAPPPAIPASAETGSPAREVVEAAEIAPVPVGGAPLPDMPAETAPETAAPATIPGSYPPSPVPTRSFTTLEQPAATGRQGGHGPVVARRPALPWAGPVKLARVRLVAFPPQRLPLARSPLATAPRPAYAAPVRYPGFAAFPPIGLRPYGVVVVRRPVVVTSAPSIYEGGRRLPSQPPGQAVLGPYQRVVVGPYQRGVLANWQAMAAMPPRSASGAGVMPPAAAPTWVGQIRTVVVRPGDTLWAISLRAYGPGASANYANVVQANAGTIRDPQVIVAGQTVVLPAPAAGGTPGY